jgi:predicted nuclease with TOPRIM domain
MEIDEGMLAACKAILSGDVAEAKRLAGEAVRRLEPPDPAKEQERMDRLEVAVSTVVEWTRLHEERTAILTKAVGEFQETRFQADSLKGAFDQLLSGAAKLEGRIRSLEATLASMKEAVQKCERDTDRVYARYDSLASKVDRVSARVTSLGAPPVPKPKPKPKPKKGGS